MSDEMKIQTPNSKLQINSKHQIPAQRPRSRLDFGIWSLFGFCILGLGFFSASAAVPSAITTRDPVRVDEKTDTVIKGALKWLASKQAPNGAWGSTDMEQQHPIAMTGYAIGCCCSMSVE